MIDEEKSWFNNVWRSGLKLYAVCCSSVLPVRVTAFTSLQFEFSNMRWLKSLRMNEKHKKVHLTEYSFAIITQKIRVD